MYIKKTRIFRQKRTNTHNSITMEHLGQNFCPSLVFMFVDLSATHWKDKESHAEVSLTLTKAFWSFFIVTAKGQDVTRVTYSFLGQVTSKERERGREIERERQKKNEEWRKNGNSRNRGKDREVHLQSQCPRTQLVAGGFGTLIQPPTPARFKAPYACLFPRECDSL